MRITKLASLRGLRSEGGQVIALTAIMLVGIVALGGFVVDVSTWFLGHRQEQAMVDASALAAASALPENPTTATALGQQYSAQNGGSSSSLSITYRSKYFANDTVTVEGTRSLPSFLSKVVGLNSVDVTATAVARAEALGATYGASPFGVWNTDPELDPANGCPCYGVAETLTLATVGPGGFKIINIDGSSGGTSPQTLADWIENGCDCTSSTNSLYWFWNSNPGAKYNSQNVKTAMSDRIGDVLMFPVFDQVIGQGANLEYRIIGFAAFRVTGFNFNGNNGKIMGHFEKLSSNQTGDSTGGSGYFGVSTPTLVDESS